MADFCMQCSIELFGEDFGDLANLSTINDTANKIGKDVLCEGCGPTVVDHTGKCVGELCDKKHGLVKGEQK